MCGEVWRGVWNECRLQYTLVYFVLSLHMLAADCWCKSCHGACYNNNTKSYLDHNSTTALDSVHYHWKWHHTPPPHPDMEEPTISELFCSSLSPPEIPSLQSSPRNITHLLPYSIPHHLIAQYNHLAYPKSKIFAQTFPLLAWYQQLGRLGQNRTCHSCRQLYSGHASAPHSPHPILFQQNFSLRQLILPPHQQHVEEPRFIRKVNAFPRQSPHIQGPPDHHP